MNFGGVEETVVTRDEFPLEKAREVLKNETIAVIGYGVQGPGQSLNLSLCIVSFAITLFTMDIHTWQEVHLYCFNTSPFTCLASSPFNIE